MKIMSFSNNCKPEKMPGPLKGNPLTGLCEKTSIQVDKVFDACIKQYSNTETRVVLRDLYPNNLTPPFKFISAGSTSSKADICNLVVSDIPESDGCARVSGVVNIPITVVFVDCHGRQGTGKATIAIPRDIVMHVASESIMPYDILAEVNLLAPSGEYVSGDCEPVFSITYCATVIMKVVMRVQLLVPSYGYTFIPPCQEFTQDVCDGLFDLPIYPNDCGCS